MQKALEESKRLIEDDDGSLQAALALSLQGKIHLIDINFQIIINTPVLQRTVVSCEMLKIKLFNVVMFSL